MEASFAHPSFLGNLLISSETSRQIGVFPDMNRDEKTVNKYLTVNGFSQIEFEPFGKGTIPDFIVNGSVAVEARRLNQQRLTGSKLRGLEEDSFPIRRLVQQILEEKGPPTDGRSWLVSYHIERTGKQVKNKEIKSELLALLSSVEDGVTDHRVVMRIPSGLEITLSPTPCSDQKKFELAVISDWDEGGNVISKLVENIEYCISEKSEKIRKAKEKNPSLAN